MSTDERRERENTAFANEHADRFYERATAAEDKCARLREENGNFSDRLVKLAQENARLRAELEQREAEAAKFDNEVQRAMERRMKKFTEQCATIERVRALVDEFPNDAISAGRIRAALEGDTNA